MSRTETRIPPVPEIINRKVNFEYEILQKFEAGMVLTGSEIKSLRDGKVTMSDAYACFEQERLVLRNMNIALFAHASYLNHEPLRDRYLLLNKTELRKIRHRITEKGLSLVPLRLYFSERGFAKVEIALARGRKSYDKRQAIKEKDLDRDQRSEV
ncbi:MAG: SsrA-binding protein SmpB [Sphingomonadales bacterium]|nr:SsrA-binding protein SmpB [Sphingomonadales bacterium]